MTNAHRQIVFINVGMALLCLVLLLRAFVWMQYYLPEFPGLATQQMVDGTGNKPFVYRALVPQMAAIIDSAIPESATPTLANAARGAGETVADIARMETPAVMKNDDAFFRMRFITGGIMLAFLAAYGFALYRLGEILFPRSAGHYAAPVIGYTLIPIGLWQAAFIYDPAVLFFMAWCFYLMLKGNWPAYLICFTLAALNKETAIYILLLFALCNRDRLAPSRFWPLLLVQAAIYIVIIAGVRIAYAGNYGSMIQFHLLQYVKLWMQTVAPQDVLAVLAGLFLLAYGWHNKPIMLKRAAIVAGAATLVWLCCGRYNELRGLYDAFPLFTLLLTHSFLAAIKRG